MSNSQTALIRAAIEYRDTIGSVDAWLPGESEIDDDTVRTLIEAALIYLDDHNDSGPPVAR